MICNRGDVLLALYPDSNLRTAKVRPVLAIQAGGLGTRLPQTVVVMITSNLTRAGHPSRVRVTLASAEGAQAGLRQDSVIMTDNIATVMDSEIRRVLGVWADMAEVDRALRHTLGL